MVKNVDISTILWFLSVTCICFSIINFYLPIFRFETRFILKSWILLVFAGAWGVASAIATILNCVPPSNFWKMKDMDKCGDFNLLIFLSALFEIFITAGILVLPIKPVIGLTLSRQTRASIMGIFLLGAL